MVISTCISKKNSHKVSEILQCITLNAVYLEKSSFSYSEPERNRSSFIPIFIPKVITHGLYSYIIHSLIYRTFCSKKDGENLFFFLAV